MTSDLSLSPPWPLSTYVQAEAGTSLLPPPHRSSESRDSGGGQIKGQYGGDVQEGQQEQTSSILGTGTETQTLQSCPLYHDGDRMTIEP